MARKLVTVEANGEDQEIVTVGEEVQGLMEIDNSLSPQLSFHVISGTSSYQTTRVKGSVGTRIMFLLIDSGSTHNFLDAKMARLLGCTLEQIPELRVAATNGNVLACNEICRVLQWGMQCRKFKANFFNPPFR